MFELEENKCGTFIKLIICKEIFIQFKQMLHAFNFYFRQIKLKKKENLIFRDSNLNFDLY